MCALAKAATIIVLGILAAGGGVLTVDGQVAQQSAQGEPLVAQKKPDPRPVDRAAFQKWAEQRWGDSVDNPKMPFQLFTLRLLVSDVEASLDHYHKLGFTLASYRHPERTTRITEASMSAGQARLELRSKAKDDGRGPGDTTTVLFYVEGQPGVEDNLRELTEFRARLANCGVKVSELRNNENLVEFFVEDADANLIGFNTNRR